MKRISLFLIIAIILIMLTGCSVAQSISNETVSDTNHAFSIQIEQNDEYVLQENEVVIEDEPSESVSITKSEQENLLANVSQNNLVLTVEPMSDGTHMITDVTYNPDDFTATVDYVVNNPAGYNITKIAQNAFRNCKVIKSLDLTKINLTSIEAYAFYGCENLNTINFPQSLTSVGASAFNGTPYLSLKRNNFGLLIINGILVDGGTAKEDVVIPAEVKSMSPNAFEYNSKITSVSFANATNLEVIPFRAFSNCKNLISVNFANIKYIKRDAFLGCEKLQQLQNCKETLIEIDDYAFYQCKMIKTLDFSSSGAFKKIGKNAFWGCEGLESIIFGPQLNYIDTGAFVGCKSLTSVDFGANTNNGTICSYAFAGCPKLTTLQLPSNFVGEDEYFKNN